MKKRKRKKYKRVKDESTEFLTKCKVKSQNLEINDQKHKILTINQL